MCSEQAGVVPFVFPYNNDGRDAEQTGRLLELDTLLSDGSTVCKSNEGAEVIICLG